MTLIPDLERDLVAAAGRMRAPRGRARRAAPVAVAVAAAVAVAGLLAAAGGLLRCQDTGDSSPAPRAGEREDPPVPPPPPQPRPVPGSLSAPVTFGFDGMRYRVIGFRSRTQDSVCIRLSRPGEVPAIEGVTCAGERNLRRGLRNGAVLNVGAGGGRHLSLAGFARADTTRLGIAGTAHRGRVALTEPWRPTPWRGEPIRAFYAVVDAPAGRQEMRTEELLRIRVEPAGP